MESNNLPVIGKKAWSIVRVFLFMLRKGISKAKLIRHLSMFLKRPGKLAGKAIADLLSHHHRGGSTASHDPHLQFFSAAREYEFSCSNTPNYTFLPVLGKRHHRHNPFFACAHAPSTHDDDAAAVNNALKVALEMLENNNNYSKDKAVEASPALPGLGRSPMVRQLRVTDSPFPMQDGEEDRDHQVDKAAEEFIKRFYRELRNQA